METTRDPTEFVSFSIRLSKQDLETIENLSKEQGMKKVDLLLSCLEIVEGVTLGKEIKWT